MNHHKYPIMLTQQAINGALDIYVECRKRDCVPQMIGPSFFRAAFELLDRHDADRIHELLI